MKSVKTMIVAATLSVAVMFGAGATGASAAPSTHASVALQTHTPKVAASTIRPAASGACWAQAGRVIGGFYGALISSAASPWAAAALFAAYLGQMSQEKKDKYGNFAC